MQSVVFLDRATIAPHVTLRAPAFPHTWRQWDATAPEEVPRRLADGPTIVITNKVRLTRDVLKAVPSVKLIAVAATGTDVVDLEACRELGITVCNIRGYATTTVPEHTFALIFALRRSLLAYRDSVARGRWQDSGQFCFFDHPITDLAGSRLGVIGSGSLGGRVAEIGRTLGMDVVLAGRKGMAAATVRPPHTPFEEVVATADVLTLHCPLTPETRGLLGEAEFRAMGRKPLVINTGRGGLIDDAALARALREGQVAGAGIDVAFPEPPPKDHPLMGVLDMPNVIVTPHVAWASTEAMQALADQLIGGLEAFVAGTPRNVVA